MKKLKPNDERAKAAIILIWIILGLEVLSLISSYMQLNLLGYADTDLMYFLDNVNANDLRELIIGWTYTDRKSTRLNSSHVRISYAVFCLKKKREMSGGG